MSNTRLERLTRALSAPQPGGGPVEVIGASGGFTALLLAAVRAALERPLIVVVADESRARELARGLAFFEHDEDADANVSIMPTLDHIPFQGMSPSRSAIMQRVSVASSLATGRFTGTLVVPAAALIQRSVPADVLRAADRVLEMGGIIDRDELARWLAACGYHAVPAVEDPGTFAVRGGIVDIFPPGGSEPVRIELFDDEIESLRLFNPDTQRTREEIAELTIGPAREILFTPERVQRATHAIHDLADTLHLPSRRVRAIVDDIAEGIVAVGMEDLLPTFYPALGSLFDLIPDDALWIAEEPERCAGIIEERWATAQERSERARTNGLFALDAAALYLDAETANASLKAATNLRLCPLEVDDATVRPALNMRFDVEDNRDLRRAIEQARRDDKPLLGPLRDRIRAWRKADRAVVICAHTAGGAERLSGLLNHYGVDFTRHEDAFDLSQVPALKDSSVEAHLFIGEPGRGFLWDDIGLALVDESEVLGTKAHRGQRRTKRTKAVAEHAIASWRDLREGDHIVHLSHGVGRYLQLMQTTVNDIEVDFLQVEYAGGHKLFVPMDKLHLVSRHAASEGSKPVLDKLGGTGWQRVTKRVRRAVRDIADKLLKLYAEREMRQGEGLLLDAEMMARFEAAFPWEETPDQQRAIDETVEDLQRDRPMDRLICGDVGFGKTEVAMRAAFVAAMAGKQVVVLVPTLVLAEQHRQTFEQRFEGLPITIDVYTRALIGPEEREAKRRIASGASDIIIGTHRLLSKDLDFRDLGLVIIDEEHRFGVAQKERLKELRRSVHVLTLTATPIPRTLHLSMVGLRDISLIQTPPIDRHPIRTVVAQPNEHIITEAIEAELARGGQVFFVHNRVETIAGQAELISRLVPRARVVVGHGQMAKSELQKVMLGFVRGETNVLVCTTIIESGIDIPRANTVLIDRADRFGLSQLYQIRGRVGRSTLRAHCYLLVPSPKNLAGNAKERLAAIQRFTELGSGFQIATHDLDIRGAGEILGADQSGNIDAMGYDAYMALLQEAIEDLRSQDSPGGVPRLDPELAVAIEGRIPASWLPDTALRLRLYKHLAAPRTVEALFEAYQGAVDRYGQPPDQVRDLVELMAVKICARTMGIAKVGFNAKALSLTVARESPLAEPAVLMRWLGQPGPSWRITPDGTLIREVDDAEWALGAAGLLTTMRTMESWVRRHQ